MRSPNNKKAVIYARTATAPTGRSINSQIEMCSKFVFANDLFVEKIFIDNVVSGVSKDKPQRAELFKYLKEKRISYIIVSHLDRWLRDSLDLSITVELLQKLGIKLVDVSVQDDLTPEQELKAAMYRSLNQYHRIKRSEMIKKGIEAKKQRQNSQ